MKLDAQSSLVLSLRDLYFSLFFYLSIFISIGVRISSVMTFFNPSRLLDLDLNLFQIVFHPALCILNVFQVTVVIFPLDDGDVGPVLPTTSGQSLKN